MPLRRAAPACLRWARARLGRRAHQLADVVLRQGKYKDAAKLYEDAVKGAKDDKRLDLIGRTARSQAHLWLQASTEKDKKAKELREKAIGNYRDALATIETLRQEVFALMKRALLWPLPKMF